MSHPIELMFPEYFQPSYKTIGAEEGQKYPTEDHGTLLTHDTFTQRHRELQSYVNSCLQGFPEDTQEKFPSARHNSLALKQAFIRPHPQASVWNNKRQREWFPSNRQPRHAMPPVFFTGSGVGGGGLFQTGSLCQATTASNLFPCTEKTEGRGNGPKILEDSPSVRKKRDTDSSLHWGSLPPPLWLYGYQISYFAGSRFLERKWRKPFLLLCRNNCSYIAFFCLLSYALDSSSTDKWSIFCAAFTAWWYGIVSAPQFQLQLYPQVLFSDCVMKGNEWSFVWPGGVFQCRGNMQFTWAE